MAGPIKKARKIIPGFLTRCYVGTLSSYPSVEISRDLIYTLLAGPYNLVTGPFLLFQEVFTLLADEVLTAYSASSHATPFEFRHGTNHLFM